MNVILVVFDSLRKDCVGCYGQPPWGKVHTPVLDALAKEINTIPAGIVLHPRVAKIYDDRRKMAAGEVPGGNGHAVLHQTQHMRRVGLLALQAKCLQ